MNLAPNLANDPFGRVDSTRMLAECVNNEANLRRAADLVLAHVQHAHMHQLQDAGESWQLALSCINAEIDKASRWTAHYRAVVRHALANNNSANDEAHAHEVRA